MAAMTTLVLATRNLHKSREIQAMLSHRCRYLTLNDIGGDAPAVVEDADTFAGNAVKKAAALSRWLCERPDWLRPDEASAPGARSECHVLADDSGLEVDALNGAPGVHSARFAAADAHAAGNSPDAANNAKLLRLLEGVAAEKRIARFRCVLALAPAGPGATPAEARLFEGACEGRIGFAEKGQGGFGYDPLFIPNGFALTFAELGEEVKNKMSHRALALAKLKAWLEARGC